MGNVYRGTRGQSILNEQFESVAFAMLLILQNDKKDEVFVKVNMDLHTKST